MKLRVDPRRGRLVAFRRLSRTANINLSFEKGSIFEADALGDCVSGKRSFTVDLQPVAGIDIADNLALHDDLARSDIGIDLSIVADGYAVSGKVDRPFDGAVDVKRFRTGHLTLDDQGFADRGTIVPVSIGRLRGAHQ